MITGPQLRSARAALGLSVREVADLTGIGPATIVRYEATHSTIAGNPRKLAEVIQHFENAGIEFIGSPDDRPGIRIGRPPAQQE
jgi:transcriptional regulator with XRE-family HTH domain